MLPIVLLLAAVDLVAAFAPGQRNILDRRQGATFTGVATFVNFGGQGNTVCGPMSGTSTASFELQASNAPFSRHPWNLRRRGRRPLS